MPANIFTCTPANAAARLLKALPVKMGEIAREISAGREKSLKVKLRDRFVCVLFAVQRVGAKRFGRKYYTTDDCTGCGLCARGCTTGNIRMEGVRPVFGKSCCMCLRCVYACPANAIKPGMMRSAILEQGFDIEEMEKRPADLTQQLPGGIGWKGLREYLEDV
jgi:ferredoxin